MADTQPHAGSEAPPAGATRPRRKLALWARITLGIVAAIVALMATAVALRYWITSDMGRAFLVSQIDGRRVGPLGTLRVEGLKGDPLEAATFADIALVDDEGVWLRATDARLEWTPSRLFGGELEIAAIEIQKVDVLRTPRSTYESQNRPPPDIGLRLDSILIHELKIAEQIFRPASSFKVSGGAARPRDGSGFARLDIAPLTGPGDAIKATAEWTAEGALTGEVLATGPAGGLIATTIFAPDGKTVTFAGNLSGSLTEFHGQAQLGFSGEAVGAIDLDRKGDIANLTASLNPDIWPALEPLARRTGGAVALKGEARLADLARAPVSLELQAPAGVVMFSSVADINAMRLREAVKLSTRSLDLALIAPPVTGKIDADGTVRIIGLLGLEFKGDATVTDITWPSGGAARISGPVTISRDGSSIFWEATGAQVRGGYVTSLKDLAPASYTATTRGEVNLATRTVEVTQAQVRGAPGDVTGRGTYYIGTGAFDYAGAAMFSRLSDVAPLTGAARGQWSVVRASKDAPIRITADATGREVSSNIRALADLTGAAPQVKMTGVVREGRFTIESGRFDGAGMTASMTGRVADSGAVAGRATGALRRPLHLPATTIETASFATDISGQMTAPRVNLRLSDGSLAVLGMTADRIIGEAQATLGKTISGDFALSGGTAGQPLTARGRLQGGDGVWRIANLSATLGGLRLNAQRMEYANGDFIATFDANGSLAGYAGLDRGTLSARGTIETKDELELNVEGLLQNLREGQLQLDRVSFKAEAKGGNATLVSQMKGRLGAPVELTFGATASSDGDAWDGDATLDGKVDGLQVNTTRAATWRFGSDGWRLDTELAAFGGRLAAKLDSSPTAATADIDLMEVDFRALSRLARITPMDGKVSGEIDFSNEGGNATGDLRIEVENANPVGVKAAPIGVTLTGRLRSGELTATAMGGGAGFELYANGELRVKAGEGFNVTLDMNAPTQGRITLQGKGDQLWALFGPEGQSFTGEVDADVRVSGILGKPDMTGTLEIANAGYEHGETGMKLRNLAGRGEFNERSAQITNLSADDGAGGTVTGEGRIEWDKGLDGGVQINASNFRALGREDRSATVSGEGAVTIDTEAVRVTGEFEVQQARISVEQPASASIPRLPVVTRINFPNQEEEEAKNGKSPVTRPVQLELKVTAPRRVVVYGRGLDTEWSLDMNVRGTIANPEVQGTATLIRGDLDLAGRRFAFDTGSINLDGPIRTARIDISAERSADDIDARVHVTGSPVEPKFELESTPALPQDEILARVLFGRSMAELSGFEAAQLAAGLTQLAGGNAGFDPVGLVRKATGLDRVAIGASGGEATLSAGKYIANDVYLQVGAGGEGGVGAEVEWEPRDNLSIISSAQGNGDTKLAVRWKRDY